jgi:hypothetical protein
MDDRAFIRKARVQAVIMLCGHAGVKALEAVCRCSKIMSPPNCNETLSGYRDGDDESERVPKGESD